MDSLDRSNPEAAPGRMVNSYQIAGKLGAGGMGVVYKAWDTKLNRTVALKFLPAEIDADERSRNQVLREARAASSIDHPNVGTIHAIEETAAGESFIVMAYYEGETLAQRIKRGPLPAAQAVQIAMQMARGLSEAHAHKIVHRDMKPSNAIITRNGMVKIVDFGLARSLQPTDTTLSRTGSISGTVYYMSPEQALGKPLDHRTDLWSLGVILCQMLTGHMPFQGESAPAVLLAVTNAAPAHADEMQPDLRAVVYRALSKDLSRRYQSAAEMIGDLEKLETSGDAAATQTIGKAALAQYLESASRSILQPPSRATLSRYWYLIPVFILAVGFLIPTVRQWLSGASSSSGEKHIAVLPFTVLGAGDAGEPLADGLMESLSSKLSNLELRDKSLWVVPASEVRRRKVADAPAAQKEFGANLVVTGTVQRTGQAVRLIVNLIDTKRLHQLGSEELEDRSGDFFALQDAAVQKLARLMNITVSGDGTSAGGASPAAYELYLNALGLLSRYDKPGNLDRAVDLFQSAVKTDPQFALALAGLGEAFLLKYKSDQNPRWIDQASASCQRAVRINDQLAPVYVTLGRIHTDTGNVDLATQELQHALQLEPRNTEALAALASVYEKQGRLKDAEETLTRATVLRPDYWDSYTRLGNFYFRQRKYQEATLRLRKVVELTPDNSVGWLNLAAALRGLGKPDEAAAALQKSIQIAPSYGAYVNLGNLYYQQKRYPEAAAQYEKAVAANDKDFRAWHNLGITYLWLNRKADALSAYRRAFPLLEAAVKLSPQNATLQSALGVLYAKLQDRPNAVTHLDMAVALSPTDGSVLASAAEAYESLGDRPKALEWVARALDNGYTIESLKNDPVLHTLLDDPGFRSK